MSIKPPTFKYNKTILEHHLDTLGHVNNATYLALLEEARWDFLRKRNCGLEQIQKEKIGPVILEINITFKKEISNREEICIKSKSTGMKNNLVMSLWQGIYNAEDELAAEANFSFGMMDLSLRKLIRPSDKWLYGIGLTEKY